jgi:hypothetical protein
VAAVRRALEERHAEAAIIVPACDEELLLPRLLDSLSRLEAPADFGRPSKVVVLVHANNCKDATAAMVRRLGDVVGVLGLEVVESCYDRPNVGLVRAESAEAAFEAGCRWVLFTDADVTIKDPDFLSVADSVCDADPTACFSGWCDEFDDVLSSLPDNSSVETVAILDFARCFRGRWLPLYHGLFRYTDGSNTLITPHSYETAGGYEPKRVGGDSTLGDRFLDVTGRFPGFFDRRVVPSARKCWARGRLGGFIFYPLDRPALEKVREGSPPSRLDKETAFAAAADDLFEFILFVAGKRRALLDAGASGLAGLGRLVEEAFVSFAAVNEVPATVEFRGTSLVVSTNGHTELSRMLRLEWDVVERFWNTGVIL